MRFSPTVDCSLPEVEVLILGGVLNVGVIVAFAPQIIEIWRKRLSFGVSALNVWFALIGNGFAAVNGMMTFFGEFECCFSVDFGRCLALNMPTFQLLLPFVCSLWMTPVFAYYVKPVPYLLTSERAAFVKNWTWASFGATLLIITAVTAAPLYLFYNTTASIDALLVYRDVLGYIAAVFACLQYLPQIVLTLKTKQPGSLSLVSLVIQLVGNCLVFTYLFFFNGSAFSTVCQNLITAAEQVFLLGAIIYFRVRYGPFVPPKAIDDAALAREEKSNDVDGDVVANEPLLLSSVNADR